ncbi:MAG: hypothetical protein LBG05_09200 [Treponema sp.]|jgi:hypothetical protein|nr:hypothetical protein [Treponema sp.]
MAAEEKEFSSAAEEIAYLRKEVKRLTSQMGFVQNTLERIKVTPGKFS